MKNVVSYSLWGEHPMYWEGALHNIELVNKYFPDFICRFYIDDSCDQDLIDSIVINNKVEKIMVNSEDSFHGMFWRFWAADDPEVDVVMIRDTDSRISDREVSAINEWLKSDKDFHIMRDHPYHGVPILGGMWGCRNGILHNIGITEKINSWNKYGRKGIDQDFLGEVIYPLVKNNAMEHDDWGRYGSDVKKFPLGRENGGFVGEVYDENDVRNPHHWKLIK
tara:strand:+ start:1562 stop:2227 length:666 start_codon:yes stop_codon:yes gene_type:complete